MGNERLEILREQQERLELLHEEHRTLLEELSRERARGAELERALRESLVEQEKHASLQKNT
jgi:two-component sensor histidine kinase